MSACVALVVGFHRSAQSERNAGPNVPIVGTDAGALSPALAVVKLRNLTPQSLAFSIGYSANRRRTPAPNNTRVPDDLDVHLVMDNYATHKTPAVQRWLARHPRWHVHFTPTSASWLNQVERFFALLTEKQIRRGVHRSTQELEQAIQNYIDTVNADPRPFRWTKSADDILAAIKRFCLRTLETAANQTEIIKTSESGH